MGEAFWNTEGGEKESANNGTDAPSSSSELSPYATEHVIEGSPLMMIGGLVLFAVMAASLLSDALGDGIDYTFETVAFPVIALLLALFGYARYKKTFIVSWDQEQRHVKVLEGTRNSEERSLMFAHTFKAGDHLIIESETTQHGHVGDDDHSRETEYWLAIKRNDGTTMPVSDDFNSTYFLKRIKEHLDRLL
jgi:hypothetical protein